MVTKLCEAVCPDEKGGPDIQCERKENHKGKHDSITHGLSWTDGGAERIRAELARRAEIEREPF
jgi:hypothetical protein